MMPRGAASTMWNMDDMLAREALAGAEAFAEVVRKEFAGEAIDLKVACEHGDLPNVIERYKSDQEPPACVVMGTQGASGLQEVLFGSNTASVIKQGSFPVIAVPRDAIFSAPKRIMFAHDGGAVNETALLPLLQIARRFGSEVRIVRVVNEDSTTQANAHDADLEQLLHGLQHTSQFLSHEEVETGLSGLAAQASADMLVVLHRKRSIFQSLFKRSTAAALAMHTHLPLLALQHVEN
ncbi:MAG: universal stress protein [Flavobacteriales bacterium]|nr:universal stress protein [Flavobacteriales bacterium]